MPVERIVGCERAGSKRQAAEVRYASAGANFESVAVMVGSEIHGGGRAGGDRGGQRLLRLGYIGAPGETIGSQDQPGVLSSI